MHKPTLPAFLQHALPALCSFGLLLSATACTVTADDKAAPTFPPESGQVEPVSTELAYAPGPFGFGKGSVVANYAFVGYVNPAAQLGGPRQIIRMAEFYNPTGAGVHEPGSVFPEGTPKPLALLIDMSARW
jgi:hypothetical protein